MTSFFRYLVCCLFLIFPFSGKAMTVDWSDALPVVVNAGFENPVILFGFNPQPEPPPLSLLRVVETIDPTEATRQVSGIEPQPFRFFMAVKGGSFAFPPEPVVPPDPILPTTDGVLSLVLNTDGGQSLRVRVEFGKSEGVVDLIDIVGFNPQPEPPPLFSTPFGIDFGFDGFDDGQAVSAKMQVFDEQDNALGLSAVPLPPAAPLLPAAVFLLWCLRRRRSA